MSDQPSDRLSTVLADVPSGAAEAPPAPAAADRPGLLPLLLTREEVAELLQLSARTVKRMTSEGRIPGVCRPYGRAVRYCRATIEQWVADGCPRVEKGRRLPQRNGNR